MSETIFDKACRYLRDGKVLVLKANEISAEFAVQGNGPKPYIVSGSRGHWSCDCPAQVEVCAHVQAAKLIYKSVETKPSIYATSPEVAKIFSRISR